MSDQQQIVAALQRLDRRRRRLAMLRWAANALLLLGLWLGLFAAVDAWLAIGMRVRLVLAVLLGAALVLILIRMAIVWLGRTNGLLGVARFAEAIDPNWDERLVTAVTQMALPSQRQASATLNRALLAGVAEEIGRRPPARQLSSRRLARPLWGVAIVGVVWLIASTIPGLPLAALVGRQLLPLAAIAPVAGVRIELTPTPPAIAQGDSLTIEATLAGGSTPPVLEIGATTEELRPITMEPTIGKSYAVTLISPQQDLVYRVRAGNARTPPVFVRIQRRPGLTAMTLDIQTPGGRPMPWSPEAGTELALPVGSSVRVRFRSTEPLRGAIFRSKQGAVAADGDPDRRGWQATLPVTTDADWDVEMAGETGLTATAPTIKIRAEP